MGTRAALLAALTLAGLLVVASSSAGPGAGNVILASAIEGRQAPAPQSTPAVPGSSTVVPSAPAGGTFFGAISPLRGLQASHSGARFSGGGARSRIGAPSAATARAPHAATAAAASPNIALYGGLNKPGLTAAGNASPSAPPDSTGAIGPSNYVEFANSQIGVYDRSLNLVSSASLDTFAGTSTLFAWCDVQIQWDSAVNRWLFAFLLCNAGAGSQLFVLGWSKTADPSNLSAAGWCEFGVSTAADIFDYPKLGHNLNYLIIGGNFYGNPTTTPFFAGAGIGWVPLPANGDTSCALPSFNGTMTTLKNGDGSTNAFTPVPVNTRSNATDGYILSAYDPSGSNGQPQVTPQGKLAVWHLDSTGTLHQDADIAVNSYATPFSAPQAGTADVIDTLDGRLTQAVGDPINGIWTQHTVNGPGNRSEVDWYEVMFPAGFPNPAEMGAVSSATDSVFNAAISPETDNQGAAIFYSRVSAATLPVIAAKIRRQNTPGNNMEPAELVLATSSAADTDFTCTSPNGPPCRWGDYSGASPDPTQPNVVWGTNMFINGPSLGPPTWSDENFAILVATAPQAPTTISATAGDNSARVTWMPATFDAGTPTTSYKLTAYVGASAVAMLTVAGPGTSAIFKGLTDGTTYTFTVIAINSIGPSPESLHSNTVTPTRAVAGAPAPPIPSRPVVNQLPAPHPPPPAR